MDASENENQAHEGVEDVAVDVPGFGSLKITDVRDLTFEIVEEAEKFYFAYSAAVGFGCRRDDKGESKDAGYNLLQKEISRLSAIVEGLASEKEKEKEKVQAPTTPSSSKGSVMRDPIPVRTKGREKLDKKIEPPRRPITCGYCQGTGHNSQTCEVRKEKERADKSNENVERNTDAHPSVSTSAKRSCGYCKQSGHYT
ncbi:hypothetical protein ACLB2K_047532 [Fragaria x ananassa]